MKRTILYTSIVLAATLLCGCNNDKAAADKTGLPRVKSFVLDSEAGFPEIMKGLNEFAYAPDGRVISYTTPAQKSTYTYDGTTCSGIVAAMPSGQELQKQTVTFNAQLLPASATITGVQDSIVTTTKYEYDAAGKLKGYELSNEARTVHCDLTYDPSTGRVSSIDVVQRAGDEERKLTYRLEYTDTDNPVSLYLVCAQCVDYEPAFAFTGLDGFSCDKLVDKIVASSEGVDFCEYSFKYEFSDNGRLTTVTELVSWFSEDGSLSEGQPVIRISDIKY